MSVSSRDEDEHESCYSRTEANKRTGKHIPKRKDGEPDILLEVAEHLGHVEAPPELKKPVDDVECSSSSPTVVFFPEKHAAAAQWPKNDRRNAREKREIQNRRSAENQKLATGGREVDVDSSVGGTEVRAGFEIRAWDHYSRAHCGTEHRDRCVGKVNEEPGVLSIQEEVHGSRKRRGRSSCS